MGTATFVKRLEWLGDARVYRLSAPVPFYRWTDGTDLHTDHVVVSAVNAAFSGPETYIFPCNEDGDTYNMLELEGSFKGGLSHHEALRRAGFDTIVEP